MSGRFQSRPDNSSALKTTGSYQVAGAVGSSEVTLDVRVEDLDRWLDEAAAGKMLVILDEREPRLQQLVIGLHVHHVVFVQLEGGGGE